MLIFKDTKFIKSPFDSEAELEQVIVDNYEYLFGPDSFYLPKTMIKTADGAGTIPDGFAIDLGAKQWYIVEAELGHHDVWRHIAQQVSKQIVASSQPSTKQKLGDISAQMYLDDEYTKEKFSSLGIESVDVRKVIREILKGDPIIGIPIDIIPNDLKDWARQQRLKVKLWIVSKFVQLNNNENIIYEFPEEFQPALDTEEEDKPQKANAKYTRYDINIVDLIEADIISIGEILTMTYKPKGGRAKQFHATVLEDGSLELLDQQFSSPSNAAVAGIQAAGSDRKTVNGWTSWKNSDNKTLADLREQLLNTTLTE
ncbi:MAG: DUF4357 domain-containing protein [Clostridiaceae bacterium]|nr:DUF4357 domain-containing protein [Clostridiaceae bacterium]